MDCSVKATELQGGESTKVRTAPSTLVIEVEGGTRIETTPEHPFYVEGTGWTPAGRLAIGNAIVTRAGPSVKIVRIETKEKPATVYNFEVRDTHSYFVGNREKETEYDNSRLWVHNGDCLDRGVVDAYAKEIRDAFPNEMNAGGDSCLAWQTGIQRALQDKGISGFAFWVENRAARGWKQGDKFWFGHAAVKVGNLIYDVDNLCGVPFAKWRAGIHIPKGQMKFSSMAVRDIIE